VGDMKRGGLMVGDKKDTEDKDRDVLLMCVVWIKYL